MNMQTPGDLRPFKLRIEDYELLGRSGAFDACKVELIEGMIVSVQSEAMPHVRIKNQLMLRLDRALREIGSSLEAYVEPTLALPPHNMPEPDVIVAEYDPSVRYLGLAQARIVIEVGASSLRGDLSDKRDMYARQGVPEYWAVAVEARPSASVLAVGGRRVCRESRSSPRRPARQRDGARAGGGRERDGLNSSPDSSPG